jgi:uncharacterized protein (TIGR02217 family)
MAFRDYFDGSIDLPPTHFMPWHIGVRTESPVFFSRIINDGAGLGRGFQPKIAGKVPLPGMPLFTGDTGDLLLTCAEEIEYALAWFNARRGKWGIFRHRNWMDFKCSSSPKGYCFDKTLTTQGVVYPLVADGTATAFQLLKAYQNPIAPSAYKEIWAVEADSFTPYINGTAATGWTLDYDKGVLTFATAPASGQVITHDCIFDLWVRFDVDAMSIEALEIDRSAKVASLTVVEVALPEPFSTPVVSQAIQYLAFRHKINLDGFVYYDDSGFVPDQVYPDPSAGLFKTSTDARVSGTRPVVALGFPFAGTTQYDGVSTSYSGGYALMNSYHDPAGDIFFTSDSYLSGMDAVLPATNNSSPYIINSGMLVDIDPASGEATIVFDLNAIKADYPLAQYMVIPLIVLGGSVDPFGIQDYPFTIPDNWSVVPSVHAIVPNTTSIQPGDAASTPVAVLTPLSPASIEIRQPVGGAGATFIYNLQDNTGFWYSPVDS